MNGRLRRAGELLAEAVPALAWARLNAPAQGTDTARIENDDGHHRIPENASATEQNSVTYEKSHSQQGGRERCYYRSFPEMDEPLPTGAPSEKEVRT